MKPLLFLINLDVPQEAEQCASSLWAKFGTDQKCLVLGMYINGLTDKHYKLNTNKK